MQEPDTRTVSRLIGHRNPAPLPPAFVWRARRYMQRLERLADHLERGGSAQITALLFVERLSSGLLDEWCFRRTKTLPKPALRSK